MNVATKARQTEVATKVDGKLPPQTLRLAPRSLSARARLLDAAQHQCAARPFFGAKRACGEFSVGASPFVMKFPSATRGWIINACFVEYVPAGLLTFTLMSEVTGCVGTWRSRVSAISSRYGLDWPRFCT